MNFQNRTISFCSAFGNFAFAKASGVPSWGELQGLQSSSPTCKLSQWSKECLLLNARHAATKVCQRGACCRVVKQLFIMRSPTSKQTWRTSALWSSHLRIIGLCGNCGTWCCFLFPCMSLLSAFMLIALSYQGYVSWHERPRRGRGEWQGNAGDGERWAMEWGERGRREEGLYLKQSCECKWMRNFLKRIWGNKCNFFCIK